MLLWFVCVHYRGLIPAPLVYRDFTNGISISFIQFIQNSWYKCRGGPVSNGWTYGRGFPVCASSGWLAHCLQKSWTQVEIGSMINTMQIHQSAIFLKVMAIWRRTEDKLKYKWKIKFISFHTTEDQECCLSNRPEYGLLASQEWLIFWELQPSILVRICFTRNPFRKYQRFRCIIETWISSDQ